MYTELLSTPLLKMSHQQLLEYVQWQSFILDLIDNDIHSFYQITGLNAIPMNKDHSINIIKIEQSYLNNTIN
tara:strand:- start:659 stop:874 length:216 start_codon:yes stop_codon:yes gene_type:complete